MYQNKRKKPNWDINHFKPQQYILETRRHICRMFATSEWGGLPLSHLRIYTYVNRIVEWNSQCPSKERANHFPSGLFLTRRISTLSPCRMLRSSFPPPCQSWRTLAVWRTSSSPCNYGWIQQKASGGWRSTETNETYVCMECILE